MLCLTSAFTIPFHSRSNAPSAASNNLNAIDTYLVFCILMIFLALLEYAIVLLTINVRFQCLLFYVSLFMKLQRTNNADVQRKKSALKEALSHTDKADINLHDIFNDINVSATHDSPVRALLNNDYYKLGRVSLRTFDLMALVAMPIIFLLFNIYYWVAFGLLNR